MPKSCGKRRVTFNRVVGVHRGRSKKLKRVSATKLAYDILRAPDAANVRRLVKKHKQHGSTRKAVKESIRTLHKLTLRTWTSKPVITIGALRSNFRGALAWNRKISNAKAHLVSLYTESHKSHRSPV